MRIVGGKHRGRVLEAPPGIDVRPTADRTREALFNILAHGTFAAGGLPLHNSVVLDAFAGTGAVGLEALSRGARHAVFFELAPAARKVVTSNVARLGERDRATILNADALSPPTATETASFIFLDPPYGKGMAEEALPALAATGWIGAESITVAEVAARVRFEPGVRFTIEDERIYGAARLIFLRQAAQQ